MKKFLSAVAIFSMLAMPALAQAPKVVDSPSEIQTQIDLLSKEMAKQAEHLNKLKELKETTKSTADSIKDAATATANGAKEVAKAVPGVVKDVSAGTREELGKWSEMGAGVGKAMIATAKELGMAANEFSGTMLGKFVLFLILFKMIGKSIIGILFGVTVMAVGYRMAYRMVRPPMQVLKYEVVPVLWGAFSRRRATEMSPTTMTVNEKETRMAVACLLAAATTVISAIAIFTTT